jgi:predicted DNA-binding protein
MARPKKKDAINAEKTIAVRITTEARERLDALAAKNGSTLTDEVRRAIDAHVGARFCLKEAA